MLDVAYHKSKFDQDTQRLDIGRILWPISGNDAVRDARRRQRLVQDRDRSEDIDS
jgi:hypothetical protein